MTSVPVSMLELNELQIAVNTAQTADLTCFNNNDGRIAVTASGGDPSSGYFFTLKTKTGATVRGEQAGAGAGITWSNLAAGDYVAWVRDGVCTAQKPIDVKISEPPRSPGYLPLPNLPVIIPAMAAY